MGTIETDKKNRLVSLVLAAVLTVASLRALKSGKRKQGVLTGIGALAFGFVATVAGEESDDFDFDTEPVSTDTSTTTTSTEDSSTDDSDDTAEETAEPRKSGALTCAACGEAIVLGQRRGPNDEDEIVHADCE